METATLVLTLVLGTASFVCLFAGLMGLLAPDAAETERLQRKASEKYQTKGFFAAYFTLHMHSLNISDIARRWRSHRNIRLLIGIGAVCFVLAHLANKLHELTTA